MERDILFTFSTGVCRVNRSCAWLMALCFLPLTVHANSLDPIVTTPTGNPQRASQTGTGVEVVERQAIEALGAVRLGQVLAGRLGLVVDHQGVAVRGMAASHTLLLVDGVRWGDGLAAAQFPTELIDRVEIVRGPRVVLYGDSALAGVIQVTTKRSRQEGLDVDGVVGVYSGGGTMASSSASWRGALGSASSQASRMEGMEQDHRGIRVGADLSFGAWRVDLMGLDIREDGVSSDRPWQSSSERKLVGGKLRWQASETIELTGVLDRRWGTHEYRDGMLDLGAYGIRHDGARVQANWWMDDDTTVQMGAEWTQERADGNVDGQTWQSTRTRRTAMGQWQRTFGKQTLRAGARHDQDSGWGGHTSWDAAWTIQQGPWHWSLTHARAWTLPTMEALYHPVVGNNRLRVERGHLTELAVGRIAGSWTWEARVHQGETGDLVVSDKLAGQYRNQSGGVRMRGIELGARWQGTHWASRVQVEHEQPRVRATGLDVVGRSRTQGRADLDWHAGAWQWGATVRAAGPAWQDEANTLRQAGWVALDARVTWQPQTHWTLGLHANNLLDQVHVMDSGWGRAGRVVGLTLRVEH